MRALILSVMLAACSSNHEVADGGSDTAVPVGCGDGVKNNTEACDGTDLGSASCASATAPGWVGVVSCTNTCQINVAGCNPPTTAWKAMTDSANWSTFDLTTLFPGARGFTASVFDGKYLYLIPNNNTGAADGVVARYDTTGGFGASGSWSTFDVSTVNPLAKGFQSGAFDGRYLYLVPYNNNADYDGVVTRYDTTGSFGDAAAWSTFDLSTIDPNARGYVRAAFDGRYLYFVPHSNGAYHGVTARLDTKASFTDVTAWTTFDLSTLNAHAKGFLGAAFDGRYIYYAPYYDGAAYSGVVTRYDTQSTKGYTDPSSWAFFDLTTVAPGGVGFYSITFDGKYVYFGQYYNGVAATPGYGGLIARYDTTASFVAGAAWQAFDVSTLNAAARGYIGATFDGRFVYFMPHYNGAYHGIVTRFDTTAASYSDSTAWSMFDASTLSANAVGFDGAGFDGRYVYVIPNTNATTALGTVVRFDAKSPSWMPRSWSAAFD